MTSCTKLPAASAPPGTPRCCPISGRIGGELYLGMGENGHVTPLSVLPTLQKELDRGHVAYRIEVMPGAEHGYTMPSMPAYNPEAAERAWAGTLELLHRRLPAARG